MWPIDSSDAVCAWTRAGMESDCAAELIERAAVAGVAGWCRTGDGLVEFHPTPAEQLPTLARTMAFRELVFIRQWFARFAICRDLPPDDRIAPLARAAAVIPQPVSAIRMEYPDTDAGRPLARLARVLARPFETAIARGPGFQPDRGGPVLHCALLDGSTALLGLSDAANSAPWPLGIPRLRAHRQAPSRSVLKLDEAIARFLSDNERATWLRPGRTAVDLGAAPGGWTWLLRHYGVTVSAVDNGPLAQSLIEDPGVDHRAEDGFQYRPRRPVDWLVCDMVERPHRIARLLAEWLSRGDCRHAIVNLKLPMKQRWQTVSSQVDTIAAALPGDGRLLANQLYHDREEVTLFATRSPLTR
ncbi:23S rRNA (cytidine(2498)-2'-O)-methyltransferase RlmM [Halofilum ochraceum]|uniref:23S rRNA (cytidine(2498)-2'-O)-methyltransferase RlmM n=1 Tax=Halofilum ochraceum TaxID=1611323 RepID=UPI0008D99436|nr:23S rRNA (cytidine(2498)-2'-O)-methyltransferase RlmM [Halofilum ochraceum]